MSRVAAAKLAFREARDDERTAPWLGSPYSADLWDVCDTYGNDRVTIDFAMRMPDGRQLRDHHSLYATVKEYAFLCREGTFTKIDDAATHAMHVRSLMSVAHALSLRGVESFARVTAFDIEQLAEACRWGTNALVDGSRRLVASLAAKVDDLSAWPRANGNVDKGWALACAGLPETVRKTSQVAAVFEYCREYLKDPTGTFSPRLEEPSNLSVQAVGRFLYPIEQIYEMRFAMRADALSIRPFAQGASTEAKRLGTGTKRTPTPPPRLALLLIAQAMSFVSLNGGRIIEAAKTCPSLSGLVLVRTEAGESSSITIRSAVRLLSTACYVLVATFTARRATEIEKLRRDCLRGDPKDRWLYCPIVKTHNRLEAIPVPDIVATAVEQLLALTDGRPEDRLFRHPSTNGKSGSKVAGSYKPSSRLNDLAIHLNADRHPSSGAEWHWTSHQFRRFYAIMFFHRNHGSLEALSHHLRHFNLEVTRRYVTSDPDSAAIFMDIEWGYTGELARSIVLGTRVPLSGMDKHLANLAKRLADNFRKNLQVVTPERVASAMALLMRRRGVVVRPTRYSDCFAANTAAAARRAKCRLKDAGDAIGPDLTRAGPVVCPGCRWSAMSSHQSRNVREETQWEIVAADEPAREGTMLAMFQRERLVEVGAIYARARADIAKAGEGEGPNGL